MLKHLYRLQLYVSLGLLVWCGVWLGLGLGNDHGLAYLVVWPQTWHEIIKWYPAVRLFTLTNVKCCLEQ